MRQNKSYRLLITNGFRQLFLLLLVLAGSQTHAQIVIGGSVYGGGNEGNVGGNTTVTLRAGDLDKVFGGARMADIDGRCFVNIDGEKASDYMLINYVYAGNDISGMIGKKLDTSESPAATLPTMLSNAAENGIDKTWDAIIRISTKRTAQGAPAADAKKIYIGQLFGGGNGDYEYQNVSGTHTIYERGHRGDPNYIVASTTTDDFNAPDLGKTYLEVMGGSIVYAFGGGNNATVTEKAVIMSIIRVR